MPRSGTLRPLSDGERLIAEGERIDTLYFVTEGWFDVAVRGVQVARLGVGDVMGEMSFVEKQGASATVTAAGPARVLAVSQAALLAQFRSDEGFAARFYSGRWRCSCRIGCAPWRRAGRATSWTRAFSTRCMSRATGCCA